MIDKEVKDIVRRPRNSRRIRPEPDPSELWTDVYARGLIAMPIEF